MVFLEWLLAKTQLSMAPKLVWMSHKFPLSSAPEQHNMLLVLPLKRTLKLGHHFCHLTKGRWKTYLNMENLRHFIQSYFYHLLLAWQKKNRMLVSSLLTLYLIYIQSLCVQNEKKISQEILEDLKVKLGGWRDVQQLRAPTAFKDDTHEGQNYL